MVSLTVSDDGVGLDASRFADRGGLGMVMMCERASQLGGRFEFDSTAGAWNNDASGDSLSVD